MVKTVPCARATDVPSLKPMRLIAMGKAMSCSATAEVKDKGCTSRHSFLGSLPLSCALIGVSATCKHVLDELTHVTLAFTKGADCAGGFVMVKDHVTACPRGRDLPDLSASCIVFVED